VKYTNIYLWRCDPTRVMASSFFRCLDHTQRRTTIGRTPLDEWSAPRRDLYLITHSTQQTNIHAPGEIRTHDLSRQAAADLRFDRAATGTGEINTTKYKYSSLIYPHDFASQLEAPSNATTSPPLLKCVCSNHSFAGGSSLPLAYTRAAWLQYENYSYLEKATWM
jgi:hypothetical protein